MPSNKSYLVLSALGKDKPGIVDQLAKAIFDLGCNISDTRMTVLGGEFALLQLIEGQWNQLAKLEDSIDDLSRKLGLTIISKRTEERKHGSALLPYLVDVIALDNPGIVHHLASFFSTRGINIEDMNTSSYSAAHTGTPMFAVRMTVGIPAGQQISALREDFMEFCDAMNLDAVLEPVKG
jgi:glycine cleavage system transcriptional repressor